MKQYVLSTGSKAISLFLLIFLCSIKNLTAQNLFLVKEINTTANGSSFPNSLTVCAGKLYFFANDNSGTKYLWATQGTDITTQNIGPFVGVNNSLSSLATYNGKLFFPYNDGINGYELWTSDGTIGGTTLFKDLNTGVGNAFPAAFTVCNNKLFFIATNNSGFGMLYVSDGTASGTVAIRKASLLGGQTSLSVLNTEVYFWSDDGTGSGNGLWKSDGTVAGTVLLKSGIVPTVGIPGYSAVLNSNLYFNANDAVTGSELWISDGSAVGTHIVKNLRADPGAGITSSGNPQNLLVYNSKLYFAASDDTHGIELFVSDGTDLGTFMVKDIVPGASGSQPYQSTVYNGLLYFACWASNELWKTDGTDLGTQLVKGSLFTATKFAATWNGKMYFIFGGGFNDVWESDGTTAGTKAIHLQNTPFPLTSYSGFGGDGYFTEYNTDLYLNGQCFSIANGFEPVKLTPASVLAVHWLDVQAQWKTAATATISWQIAAALQVKEYAIQQSTDGIHFTNISIVAATSASQYSCIVPANANTKNYFRIMEQDINGSKSYSDVVMLQPITGASIGIYPNPVADKLYLTGFEQFKSITITDVTGHIMLQQKIDPGSTYINIKQFVSGTYILTANGSKANQSLQFVKQ